MREVGLVVNANAARDVRRITSLARTVDVHERTNQVARLLCGLAAAGVERVWHMAEPAHVVERAFDEVVRSGTPLVRSIELSSVRLPGGGEAVDAAGTVEVAAELRRIGVACVVSIGGDGTHRAVALGWPEVVLVPFAGGTNNAFAGPVDPTAAGLAAGAFAADPADGRRFLHRTPRFEVVVRAPASGGVEGALAGRRDATAGGTAIDGPAPSTIAIVDVAVVRGSWVGAHAIWDPALLIEAFVARSDPLVSGIAGVAGMVRLLEPPEKGLRLRFGPSGRSGSVATGPGRLVPLGPGQLVPLEVVETTPLALGARVRIGPYGAQDGTAGATLAFDGERELVLGPGEGAEVALEPDGPWILDIRGILEAAVRARRVGPSTTREEVVAEP